MGAFDANRINRLISQNKVLIFSKTHCPFCDKAKELFRSKGQPFATIELDIEPEGEAMHAELVKRTGFRTVPSIFIGGKHVGGYDAASALEKQGMLQ